MFLGHFAVGLGAKRLVPRVSLGTLFFACQLVDLVWPVLVLTGVEHVEIDPGNTIVTPLNFVSYPYSHSLLTVVAWGILTALCYGWFTRSTASTVTAMTAVVVSHWALDAVVHRPDLPLTPWGPVRVGLGLWNSRGGTMLVEAVMLGVGLALYARATRAVDRSGSMGFWGLIGALVLINLANMTSVAPPSASAVAWTALGLWLFVAWAAWVDGHRQPAEPLRRA